jgi:hypothetical protein
MSYNLEFPDERAKSPLIHHRVVRRFVERQAVCNVTRENKKARDLRQAHEYWKTKWRQFFNSHYVVAHHHQWINSADLNDVDSLYISLVTNKQICCTSPSFAPKDQLTTLLYQGLRAGVPVCFWSGYERADLKDALGHHLSNPRDLFLTQMRQLQVKSLLTPSEPHIVRQLFLVWDDPECPFPGTRTEASG